MKSNYSKGLNFHEWELIVPAEAMTGNPFHDYGVYRAILTAAKIMTVKDLEEVADRTPPQYRKLIAATCNRIVQEHLGYIWKP